MATIDETLLAIGCVGESGGRRLSLSEVDRELLGRCLRGEAAAWQGFVGRFIGLVVHVANHTAAARGQSLDDATRDDLVAEVFATLVTDDFGALRRFRRHCSLATYLTVIARRVIVRRLHGGGTSVVAAALPEAIERVAAKDPLLDRIRGEELEHLLNRLSPQEQSVVRKYHLEGKSYGEIGREEGLAENSIGPMLSRANAKMRA